jgi:fatty-acid desaturase
MNVFRIGLNFTQQNIGNSLLHVNGPKPYDEISSATERKLWILATMGEG